MGHIWRNRLLWHWNESMTFKNLHHRHKEKTSQTQNPNRRSRKERTSSIFIYILITVWDSQASWNCKRNSCFHRTKSIHGQLSIASGRLTRNTYIYISWELKAHSSKSFLLYSLTAFENCQARFLRLMFRHYWRLYKQEVMNSFSIN